MDQLLPGDIVVVRTGGLFAAIIRFGERLQGKPDLRNHVAVFHHSTKGVNWYLEGRPSGLGWRAAPVGNDPYLNSRFTITNAAQPKTDAQRQVVCMTMRRMVGAPYDWEAIEGDAAQVLHMPELWPRWGSKTMPGHVVCSSAAAWANSEAHLAAPEFGGGRFTEPADWNLFIDERGWERAAA